MRLSVTVSGCASEADELRALRGWLVADDDFRGRVEAVEAPVATGHLGPVLEGLGVVLSATAGPLATLLVAWLRNRRGDVVVEVRRPDGTSMILEATRFRGLNADEVAKLTAEAVRQLEALEDDPEDPA